MGKEWFRFYRAGMVNSKQHEDNFDTPSPVTLNYPVGVAVWPKG